MTHFLFFLIWHFNNSWSWSVLFTQSSHFSLLYTQGRKLVWLKGSRLTNILFISWGESFCRSPSVSCWLPGRCISSQHHLVNSHLSATLLVAQAVAVACNNLTQPSRRFHICSYICRPRPAELGFHNWRGGPMCPTQTAPGTGVRCRARSLDAVCAFPASSCSNSEQIKRHT